MKPVALFTCAGTPYRGLGLDCYDIARDARSFLGVGPVIAHPPCRAWGRYKAWAKPRPDEKGLALWALDLVRRNGGVLEHPLSSSLWAHLSPLERSRSLVIRQCDFGHRAEKETLLFWARLGPSPALPPSYDGPLVPVENMGRQERERTPPELARFLVEWVSTWRG